MYVTLPFCRPDRPNSREGENMEEENIDIKSEEVKESERAEDLSQPQSISHGAIHSSEVKAKEEDMINGGEEEEISVNE